MDWLRENWHVPLGTFFAFWIVGMVIAFYVCLPLAFVGGAVVLTREAPEGSWVTQLVPLPEMLAMAFSLLACIALGLVFLVLFLPAFGAILTVKWAREAYRKRKDVR